MFSRTIFVVLLGSLFLPFNSLALGPGMMNFNDAQSSSGMMRYIEDRAIGNEAHDGWGVKCKLGMGNDGGLCVGILVVDWSRYDCRLAGGGSVSCSMALKAAHEALTAGGISLFTRISNRL